MICWILEIGVVGGLIEDWSGEGIYDFNYVVEWIEVVVEVVRLFDFLFVVIGCCENLFCK